MTLSDSDRRTAVASVRDVKPEDVAKIRAIHEANLVELRSTLAGVQRAVGMRELALEALNEIEAGRGPVATDVALAVLAALDDR